MKTPKVRKTAESNNGRWKQGVSGNPKGRPPGSRNQATLIAQELLDGEAALITRSVIDKARAGDPAAQRLCMERILSPRKERGVPFDLPPIRTGADLPGAFSKVLEAMAEGSLSPMEGRLIIEMLEKFGSVVEVAALTAKVEELSKYVFQN